jgi:hypothetical protein
MGVAETRPVFVRLSVRSSFGTLDFVTDFSWFYSVHAGIVPR